LKERGGGLAKGVLVVRRQEAWILRNDMAVVDGVLVTGDTERKQERNERMILLRIIEILFEGGQARNRRSEGGFFTIDSRRDSCHHLFRERENFIFHDKAGFRDIGKVNRFLFGPIYFCFPSISVPIARTSWFSPFHPQVFLRKGL